MDFGFSKQEEAFRQEVRKFLAANNPNNEAKIEIGEDMDATLDGLPKLLAWNQALYEKGWVGYSWP